MEGKQFGILLLAIILDLLIGDPQVRYHPVALTGQLINKWENLLYKSEGTPFKKRLAGFFLVFFNVIPVFVIVYCSLRLIQSSIPILYVGLGALLLWSAISIRSLGGAAREIFNLLQDKKLVQARERLRFIVGRDTEHLNETEIIRATVETVAENISDGIIAPLFYFFIGGIPLACTYRVINTLDAMVGYQNERYRDFGWFAAKLDDLANFLPARLTAGLLVGSALCLRLNWQRGFFAIRRDARKHPSPNSGYPEAAVAGALEIQLGGINYYQGKPSFRPHLGDPLKPLEPVHIIKTIRLMHGALAIFVVLGLIVVYFYDPSPPFPWQEVASRGTVGTV
ncbi:MAG: adenosylcobinamide-phosphate synthase CbiB [Bacillota bacterium]|nr:adenosylcobinamide-phosphate synthase CbiB [Bacillota bacterium]